MKTKTIENFDVRDKDKGLSAFRGAPGSGYDDGSEHLIVQDGTFTNCRSAADFRGWPKITIRRVRVVPGPLTDVKWGRGFMFGRKDHPEDGNGIIEIEDLTVEDLGPPRGNYDLYNRDCIVIERDNGHLMIQRSALMGATDACIDAKSPVTIVNCTFGPAHRQLRVWSGVTVRRAGLRFLPNSVHTQIWRDHDSANPGVVEWLDLDRADSFFDSERYLKASGDVVYYVLDRNHPDYEDTLDELEMRHRLPWSESGLGVHRSGQSKRSLVKADNMTAAYTAGRFDRIEGAILDIIPAAEHERALATIYDPSW
ncbi:MAG: hypothetical protein QNJ92_17385 [Alphaproteobacteria bacterium]|nr:hypothetical protein [Alphaproteobacteria bacterium]